MSEKPMQRSLGQYDFEDGGFVKLIAVGDVTTSDALEMAEVIIRLKRDELKRRGHERGEAQRPRHK